VPVVIYRGIAHSVDFDNRGQSTQRMRLRAVNVEGRLASSNRGLRFEGRTGCTTSGKACGYGEHGGQHPSFHSHSCKLPQPMVANLEHPAAPSGIAMALAK